MEPIIRLQRLHAGQREIVSNRKRFNILNCGRRFGKTSLAERLILDVAANGYPVGYWSPTYKDLYEVWNSCKHRFLPAIVKKDEQVKQLVFNTGGKIDFWSLEQPDSGRGRKYKRIIVDEAEKAKKFNEAWQNTILPTLMDFKGDAWVLSTPKFGQTFFKTLFKLGKSGRKDWASFNLSTYQNPFIDQDEIEAMRQTMDELSFRCEILAEDVSVANNPFAYAFDKDRHITAVEYNSLYPVVLSFDFNVDPITCIAVQHIEGCIKVIKEFYLRNSDIYQLTDAILTAFPKAVFTVTGDATGANRSALTQGNYGYYDVVQRRLNLGRQQMRQPAVNPSIRDTRVLVNSLLQNYCVQIDPSCEWLIKDLQYVEVDGDGDIIKDRANDLRKADLLDCFRYYCNTNHRDWVRLF